MITYKLDDSLIYEILNFIYHSPDTTTTLRDIVDNTSLSDYDAGNTAISEIMNMGLLAAKSKDGVITVTLDKRGNGKLFLDNHKLVSRLKLHEKIITFFLGILSGCIISHLVPAIISATF